ncbi:hypothetical protein HMY34_13880 [Thiothrix subterranea]|uniref:hypothetical protein n=1 Tax=Thiothrix subterranea TaxID=2735563 RepID=UPI00192CCCD2|nr:hypothetical protein [Thiothrix subterranea]QQZ29775.1 hypothetical protein HMY34_13880 [Thiothrix subterranea]
MLFDIKFDRVCTDKDRGKKSHFEFINNSALPEYCKIRSLLNMCFNEFDEKSQNDIRSRIIKNKSEEKFYSTCFELLVAHIFRRLGCQLEEHPNISDTNKRPDFLVTLSDGEYFYLENMMIGA